MSTKAKPLIATEKKKKQKELSSLPLKKIAHAKQTQEIWLNKKQTTNRDTSLSEHVMNTVLKGVERGCQHTLLRSIFSCGLFIS